MIDKRCVVILGAGASVPFNVPIHKHLLALLNPDPSTEGLNNSKKHLKEALEYLEENCIFKGKLEKIREELPHPPQDKPNLETIMTVIRVLESMDIPKMRILKPLDLPHFGEIIKFIDLFPKKFFHTSNNEKFKKYLYIFLKKVVYDDKRTLGLNPWHVFFDYCDEFEQVTWCSFNWDCILENSFYRRRRETMKLPDGIIYPGDFSNTPVSEKHKLLKLHGGINLWKEDDQDEIIQLIPGPGKGKSSDQDYYVDTQWKAYEKNAEINGHPVILEPSAFKYTDPVFQRIEAQWEEFERELNMANAIIIIGYSLPDFDEKAQTALKSAAEKNQEAAIIVFDPDRQVYCKYKKVFCKGQTVKKAENPYGGDNKESIKSELTQLYDPAQ